ncbi:DUF6343 family protein [Streptomyces sp. AV19]|uniref:DUF6343 family protein n=1 Tax=Streptomyces sp. AV19 TaxID=2793068 RepID=UPI0024132345|nr:DUF6343 family protein [Streptomyces sp. AV19]MDG4532387.1 DUF6343 family protein [Streptomyces sp. AV19]
MQRSGNEPMTARSPLRLRCGLASFGLVVSAGGAWLFAASGHPGWAAAFAVLALVTVVDLTLIIRHLRQGPHWQPGRDVPPYDPVDDRRPRR